MMSFEIELKTRDDLVADKIREAILHGALKPGEKIDEIGLAERLEVSRTPVRAALRTLAAEGLVTIYPHKGAIVNELSPEGLEEIYYIRSLLEGNAASLGASAMDDERLRELRSIQDRLKAAVDPDEWLELNAGFHHTIYAAAGLPRLVSMIRTMRNMAAPFIRHYIASRSYRANALVEHERILSACERRDGKLAHRETELHLGTVVRTVKQQLEL